MNAMVTKNPTTRRATPAINWIQNIVAEEDDEDEPLPPLPPEREPLEVSSVRVMLLARSISINPAASGKVK